MYRSIRMQWTLFFSRYTYVHKNSPSSWHIRTFASSIEFGGHNCILTSPRRIFKFIDNIQIRWFFNVRWYGDPSYAVSVEQAPVNPGLVQVDASRLSDQVKSRTVALTAVVAGVVVGLIPGVVELKDNVEVNYT